MNPPAAAEMRDLANDHDKYVLSQVVNIMTDARNPAEPPFDQR